MATLLIPITPSGNLLLLDNALPAADALRIPATHSRTFTFTLSDATFETRTVPEDTAATLTASIPHLTSVPLRPAYTLLPPLHWQAAAKARELTAWDADTRFCQRCGSPMQPHSPISKRCTACQHEIFPTLSPAIIVLIRRGNTALLVHARNFSAPFYGLVAGFVETGESLEECVRREVLEETSLKITNIRYFASQSWPFPSSLMIAFTADYESGTLRFADGELTHGDFFTPDNIPPLPSPPSIARRLIDHWLQTQT